MVRTLPYEKNPYRFLRKMPRRGQGRAAKHNRPAITDVGHWRGGPLIWVTRLVRFQHIPANFKDFKDFNFKRSVDRRSSGLVLGTSAFAPRDCEIPHSDQFPYAKWCNGSHDRLKICCPQGRKGSSPFLATSFKCIGERSLVSHHASNVAIFTGSNPVRCSKISSTATDKAMAEM